ncbi:MULTISPECIES: YybS family protein [Sporolactobacillus]|uniref:DUF2232 domain-containing protein n=2 Tax=Sporolactobacillus TaxID=2077 RepID=A0A0U1QNJ8_9BACL|nr:MULTISPECIES: YybS family protein [Sporolactobacillus]KLI02389.1 hypothetical protein SINU_08365 [Sporolactobacillus inulinus CASD]QAA23892.1 Maf-like protein [Sporolactobacillus terrae]QAA26863.1 Maf-like protein [Sporolactobacillus terrae]UAK15922.1 YybS family protein [Sporolactobacillus terrae]BBO00430.1 membrane protein [Sporolactobacillus terrae]
MTDRNVLLRGALAVILLYLLLVFTFFVPYLSLLSIWLIPLPLMYLGAKDGWKASLCTFALGVLFLVFADHSLYSLLPIFFMILGGALGYMLQAKKSAFALLLAGSLTNIVVLIVYLAISVLAFHFNPVTVFQSNLNDSLNQTIQQMQPMMEQNADELMAQIRTQMNHLLLLTPVILIMAGVFYAFIVILIALPILRKLKIDAPRWVPFRLWQVPRSIIWLYLAVLFIGWFGIDQETPLFTAVLNIDVILQILLAVQGLSLIYYYAHMKKFPLIVPITLTILIGMFGFLLLQLVRILGIIDLGFDLRKRIGRKSHN